MQDIYESIYNRYYSKDAYSSHYSSIHSIGNFELGIGFYDKIIEIRVMQKDQFILSLSISKDSFGMWEPKPRVTRGKERCLEILREEHPDVFEWCLWNL
jgi:hypothetical protein